MEVVKTFIKTLCYCEFDVCKPTKIWSQKMYFLFRFFSSCFFHHSLICTNRTNLWFMATSYFRGTDLRMLMTTLYFYPKNLPGVTLNTVKRAVSFSLLLKARLHRQDCN